MLKDRHKQLSWDASEGNSCAIYYNHPESWNYINIGHLQATHVTAVCGID